MDEFKIPEQLLIQVLQYLLTRPMMEVEQIVAYLRNLELITNKENKSQ